MVWYVDSGELDDFLARPAPRDVPRAIRRAAAGGRTVVANGMAAAMLAIVGFALAALMWVNWEEFDPTIVRNVCAWLPVGIGVQGLWLLTKVVRNARMGRRTLRYGRAVRAVAERITGKKPGWLPRLETSEGVLDPFRRRAWIQYCDGDGRERSARVVPPLGALDAVRIEGWIAEERGDLRALISPDRPDRAILVELWVDPAPLATPETAAATDAVDATLSAPAATAPKGSKTAGAGGVWRNWRWGSEALRALLAQETPREVPAWASRLAARGRRRRMAGAGCGLLMLACGLFAVAWVFPWTAPVELLMACGWRAEAPGTVAAPERRFGAWRWRVRFTPEGARDGRAVETAFYDDRWRNTPWPDPATVTYFPPWPGFAYAEGGRLGAVHWLMGLLGSAFFGGIASVGYSLASTEREANRFWRRILRDGRRAVGRIEGFKSGVHPKRNGKRADMPLAVTVRYTREDGSTATGTYVFPGRNTHRLACRARFWFEREHELDVLYLPDAPGRVALVALLENVEGRRL